MPRNRHPKEPAKSNDSEKITTAKLTFIGVIVAAALGLIGVIYSSTLGYLGDIQKERIPIDATQTAEAKNFFGTATMAAEQRSTNEANKNQVNTQEAAFQQVQLTATANYLQGTPLPNMGLESTATVLANQIENLELTRTAIPNIGSNYIIATVNNSQNCSSPVNVRSTPYLLDDNKVGGINPGATAILTGWTRFGLANWYKIEIVSNPQYSGMWVVGSYKGSAGEICPTFVDQEGEAIYSLPNSMFVGDN